MTLLNQLCMKMIEYYENDSKRIHHFLSVHAIAKLIAEEEKLDKYTIFIIEAASYVHDIGIKAALAKYNSCSGPYQEIEGEPIAKDLLMSLGFELSDVDRICYLVAHHHQYNNIDGIDYQILVEADFLVNFTEDKMTRDSILNAYDKIFKTGTGQYICEEMYKIK